MAGQTQLNRNANQNSTAQVGMLAIFFVLCFVCDQQFTTEGFCVLMAMQLTGMDTIEEMPRGLGEDALAYLQDLSQRIVQHCWSRPEEDDIRKALGAYVLDDDGKATYMYCICGQGKLFC